MTVVVRPCRPDDAEPVWRLFADSDDDTTGMTSLPSSLDGARSMCDESARVTADLATGSFEPGDGETRRLLFLAVDDGDPGAVLGVTGVTVKQSVPNLAVQVTTSGDGMGLIMASVSAPWTRTELDSTYLGPEARGRGLGTVLSRGRLMLLQIVRRQVPAVVVSHLRGVFDSDGTAHFWRHFGSRFAPQWPTSTEAEKALEQDPELLAGMAGHILELTAPVLDSLGAVNAASLPAFHLLRSEGLEPNGMYDPIDGGPTLVANIAGTTSARHRTHGRVRVGDPTDPVDGLVSVAAVDRFRVVRTGYESTADGAIVLTAGVAEGLGVDDGSLVATAPVQRDHP